jgi:hypothetical protein
LSSHYSCIEVRSCVAALLGRAPADCQSRGLLVRLCRSGLLAGATRRNSIRPSNNAALFGGGAAGSCPRGSHTVCLQYALRMRDANSASGQALLPPASTLNASVPGSRLPTKQNRSRTTHHVANPLARRRHHGGRALHHGWVTHLGGIWRWIRAQRRPGQARRRSGMDLVTVGVPAHR